LVKLSVSRFPHCNFFFEIPATFSKFPKFPKKYPQIQKRRSGLSVFPYVATIVRVVHLWERLGFDFCL
jgi:hypothetical protein